MSAQINANGINDHNDTDAGKEPFTLDEFLRDNYTAVEYNGTWFSGEYFFYFLVCCS